MKKVAGKAIKMIKTKIKAKQKKNTAKQKFYIGFGFHRQTIDERMKGVGKRPMCMLIRQP